MARQAIRSARAAAREELFPSLLVPLADRSSPTMLPAHIARLGNAIVPELTEALASADVPIETRREIPSVLLRIGSPEAEEVLVDGRLQADGTLRLAYCLTQQTEGVAPDVRVSRE